MLYEIHITVNTTNIEQFKKDCSEVGVKPIVIDTQKGEQQVMTSSSYKGMFYKWQLFLLSFKLKRRGYEILRKKVEMRPEKGTRRRGPYYETHFRLKLPLDFDMKKLDLTLDHLQWHLKMHKSKNLFKKTDTHKYQMLTYRKDFLYYEFDNFKHAVDRLANTIKTVIGAQGGEMDKVEIEECIYDSNIDIDKNWING